MAHFPTLNTGSSIQFPIRIERGPVRTHLKFWGGSSQSYLQRADSPMAWTIQYKGLNEDELRRLLSFCEDHLSTGTLFAFEDPTTGITYGSCSLEPSSIGAATTDTNCYEFVGTIVLERG